VGTNRRYGERIDEATLARQAARPPAPATLPPEAWGAQPIDWNQARTPVWVWAQWHDRAAVKMPAYVKGHNDRVCCVMVEGPGGGWEIVVWRAAVTHRRA
jgi:hypothetical protein